MISQIKHTETPGALNKEIDKLEKKIKKAQDNVEKQLDKNKYPIWELNPVISDLFANVEFYQDASKQKYILEWISEQERIDQLFDAFKNAIPIALSIMCFFMPGGVSVALLILQGANATAGAVAAIDDINDAARKRDMAYSQFVSSDEATRMVEESDLNDVERNYAMVIISGIFSIADFADCLKIASKLGITDDVLKYVSNCKVSEADIKKLFERVKSCLNGDVDVKNFNFYIFNYLEQTEIEELKKICEKYDYTMLTKISFFPEQNVRKIILTVKKNEILKRINYLPIDLLKLLKMIK